MSSNPSRLIYSRVFDFKNDYAIQKVILSDVLVELLLKGGKISVSTFTIVRAIPITTFLEFRKCD